MMQRKVILLMTSKGRKSMLCVVVSLHLSGRGTHLQTLQCIGKGLVCRLYSQSMVVIKKVELHSNVEDKLHLDYTHDSGYRNGTNCLGVLHIYTSFF